MLRVLLLDLLKYQERQLKKMVDALHGVSPLA